MEIAEILSTLSVYHKSFPKEAVEAAIEKKDEIIPGLMVTLRYTIDNTDETIDKEYWGHIYSLYLLAQFRVKEAYPLVIELLELPEKRLSMLFGDFSGMESVMASVSGGDTSLIKRLIENRDADEYIRCHAQDALITLFVAGMMSRDDLVNYYRELFEAKLEKEPAPVWDSLVDCCANIHADELKDQIMDAFDSDLAWEGSISKSDVEEAFAMDKESTLERLKKDYGYHLIDNVEKEMSWWACFNENDFNEDDLADPFHGEPVRTEPKIGRNQPCPCGSGKKYKKCCGKPEGQ